MVPGARGSIIETPPRKKEQAGVIPFIVGSLAVFAAGYVQGCAGFGFSMVAVPPMMMVMPPTTVVPILVLLSLLNTTYLALRYRRHVLPGLVGPLCAGGLLGLPVGMLFLTRVPGPGFKIACGALIIAVAVAVFTGWRHPIRNRLVALCSMGVLSGALNGSMSLSGPPVILFLASQDTPRDVFRANLVAYFTLLNIVAVPAFIAWGLVTREVVLDTLVFVPILIPATLLGARMGGRIPEKSFQKLAMACVAVLGALLISQSVASLF